MITKTAFSWIVSSVKKQCSLCSYARKKRKRFKKVVLKYLSRIIVSILTRKGQEKRCEM